MQVNKMSNTYMAVTATIMLVAMCTHADAQSSAMAAQQDDDMLQNNSPHHFHYALWVTHTRDYLVWMNFDHINIADGCNGGNDCHCYGFHEVQHPDVDVSKFYMFSMQGQGDPWPNPNGGIEFTCYMGVRWTDGACISGHCVLLKLCLATTNLITDLLSRLAHQRDDKGLRLLVSFHQTQVSYKQLRHHLLGVQLPLPRDISTGL